MKNSDVEGAEWDSERKRTTEDKAQIQMAPDSEVLLELSRLSSNPDV
jgi:hypothetical protein